MKVSSIKYYFISFFLFYPAFPNTGPVSAQKLECSQIQSSKINFQNKEIILCFISDTQEPNFFERLYLKYDRNSEARDKIYNEILKISPSCVIHLGDLTSFGFNEDSWTEIDKFNQRLIDKEISFAPVPGNHEYLLFPHPGIRNYVKRYPFNGLTGYSLIFGNVAVILLNSNFDELNDNEIRKQSEWYKNSIENYDSISSVKFIIVCCHHSPYTNSKTVQPSDKVRNCFLPPFLNSKKCRLFLSGHAHTFEHFKIIDKDFLVIGGGGGSQHEVSRENCSYNDLYESSVSLRMFHFLKIYINDTILKVELNMLEKDFESFNRNYVINYILD